MSTNILRTPVYRSYFGEWRLSRTRDDICIWPSVYSGGHRELLRTLEGLSEEGMDGSPTPVGRYKRLELNLDYDGLSRVLRDYSTGINGSRVLRDEDDLIHVRVNKSHADEFMILLGNL